MSGRQQSGVAQLHGSAADDMCTSLAIVEDTRECLSSLSAVYCGQLDPPSAP